MKKKKPMKDISFMKQKKIQEVISPFNATKQFFLQFSKNAE